MAIIRCPACGKPNPDFLEMCQYCDARLPGASAREPQATPEAPTPPVPAAPTPADKGIIRCPSCGKPNPVFVATCQYCDTRLRPLAPGEEEVPAAAPASVPEPEAEPEAAAPGPSQPEPDWLWSGAAGERAETPAPAQPQPEPDWLWSGTAAEPAQPEPAAPTPAATPAEELPDWLRSMPGAGPAEAQPAAATPAEEVPDWLRSMQGAGPAEIEPAAATPAEEVPDWLRSMPGAGPAEAQPAAATPAEEVPDWLRSMPGAELAQPEAPVEATEAPALAPPAAEAEPDWLSSFGGALPAQPEAPAVEAPPAEPEPDWLSSLRTDSAPSPTETGTGPIIPAFTELEEAPAAAPEAPTGESPDWLASLRPQDMGEIPAEMPAALAPEPSPPVSREAALSAGLAQAALPSWLQAMRPVEVQPSAIAPETDTYEETVGVLAGMRGVLQAEPTVALPRKSTVQVHKLEVTEAETALATLLTNLLSEEAQARPVSKLRVQLALPFERLIVVAVMLVAILVPYFFAPDLFPLPTTMSQDTQTAYTVIESVRADKPALVAFDYEPGQMGELDPAARAMVTHLMRRGVAIVGVSTRPTGAALGEDVLQQAAADLRQTQQVTYSYGTNYINLGYLPGGPIGVLQFALQPASSFNADFSGRSTLEMNQVEVPLWGTPLLSQIKGLNDFGLILLVEATPDSARAWIEQTQAYAQSVPMLAAVSAGADPLVRPYYEVPLDKNNPPLRGLVTGILGGAQYEMQVGLASADSLARWNVLGGGLLTAAVLLVAGNLVYGLRGVLRQQKKAR